MKSRRFSRWAAAVLLAGCLSATGGALAQTDPVASAPPTSPASPQAVLWDQTNHNNGTYTSTSNYGPSLAAFASEAADDFQVPGTVFWHISTVTLIGQYVDGSTNSLESVLLQVYGDAGTGLPGTLIASQTFASGSIGGLSTGILVVTFATPISVGPGHYWLGAQSKRVVTSGDQSQWVWNESSQKLLSESAWQQPGNAYGTGCTTWKPRITVCHRPSNSTNPDLVFKLEGTSVPVVAQLFLPLVRR